MVPYLYYGALIIQPPLINYYVRVQIHFLRKLYHKSNNLVESELSLRIKLGIISEAQRKIWNYTF